MFAYPKTLLFAAIVLLCACSPEFNWREVKQTGAAGAPYTAMLPAKPASLTRTINLDGIQVAMTMTAAEVNDVTFAIGTVTMDDAPQAQKAIAAMKTALVNNISGTIRQEKIVPDDITLEAAGMPGGKPPVRLLLARFVARDRHAYQVLVTGPEDQVSQEAAETFFTAFNIP